VAKVIEAGERGNRREFLELDYAFHRQCWELSGNPYLAQTLDRLMAPHFTVVVPTSGARLTASMGREHYEIVNALQNLQEPESLLRTTVVNSGIHLAMALRFCEYGWAVKTRLRAYFAAFSLLCR
jgi:DNA-binding GntR family transcriptional regulator